MDVCASGVCRARRGQSCRGMWTAVWVLRSALGSSEERQCSEMPSGLHTINHTWLRLQECECVYLHSGCMLSCEYVCIHAGYGFLKLLCMCGNCMFEHVYWYTWPCVCVEERGWDQMSSPVTCHLTVLRQGHRWSRSSLFWPHWLTTALPGPSTPAFVLQA